MQQNLCIKVYKYIIFVVERQEIKQNLKNNLYNIFGHNINTWNPVDRR